MQPFIFNVGEVDADWFLPLNRLKHLVERIASDYRQRLCPSSGGVWTLSLRQRTVKLPSCPMGSTPVTWVTASSLTLF
jgi:hypothetical protein